MSIATLKRKSNTKYNNMSVGQNGFSLNGTHRNQGYIGQTSLSRSLSQTPMKDGTPKGSGGCCGTYLVTPIVQSAVKSTEDSSVVKKTVMNTSGMLSSRNRWTKRGAPFSSVKPDNNNNVNSQTDYITRLQKKVIADADSCYQTKTNCPKCTTTIPNIGSMFSKRTNYDTFVKPNTFYKMHVAMPQNEYLLKLHNKCAEQDVVYVKNNNKNGPFACS
jgi:hypothetical protein